jgi:hypothetical protein
VTPLADSSSGPDGFKSQLKTRHGIEHSYSKQNCSLILHFSEPIRIIITNIIVINDDFGRNLFSSVTFDIGKVFPLLN